MIDVMSCDGKLSPLDLLTFLDIPFRVIQKEIRTEI